MALADPDRFALAAVQQYLYEHGYTKALAALEQESGLTVRQDAPRGATLLQLVYDECERQLAAAEDVDGPAARRRRLDEELLSGGAPATADACPARLVRAIEGLHSANITAIQCWPQRRQAITGSSDGAIKVLSYDGELVGEVGGAPDGVLSLAVQPQPAGSESSSSADSSSLVAAGCMGGSVLVFDTATGEVLAQAKVHAKYVVALAWMPDGRYLISGSWDQSFAVFCLRQGAAATAEEPKQAALPSCSAECPDTSAAGCWQLELLHREQTPARVTALLVLPSDYGSSETNAAGSCSTGGTCSTAGVPTFLLAVQGSNYLRQLAVLPPTTVGSSLSGSVSAGSSGRAVREVRRINLNALRDDHVSFSVAHLALSPCGRLLLVSADNGRLLVYETAGWTQLRSIVGLPMEQFHHFCAAFDQTGSYVMAAAAHGGLCIFHVGSASRVALVHAHAKTLRGLAYDARHNLLLTCSFDRSVKVWGAGTDLQE